MTARLQTLNPKVVGAGPCQIGIDVDEHDGGAGVASDQGVERRVEVTGRAERRNDLRVPHEQSNLQCSIMGQIVPDAVERYLEGLNHLADPVLREIQTEGKDKGLPIIDAEVGALLRVL